MSSNSLFFWDEAGKLKIFLIVCKVRYCGVLFAFHLILFVFRFTLSTSHLFEAYQVAFSLILLFAIGASSECYLPWRTKSKLSLSECYLGSIINAIEHSIQLVSLE